jgi:NAD(P)H-hydrate epimerase
MTFLSSAQMREWDRLAIAAGTPGGALMARAGAAVAAAAGRLAACRGTDRVVLAAGRGNNGGDAFVAARCLHAAGLRVEARLTAPPDALRGDARAAWARLRDAGVPQCVLADEASWTAPADALLPCGGVVVDGLLGTGSEGAPRGATAAAVRWVAAMRRTCGVVAVDLPSGLDADTGVPADPAVAADVTVTFGAPKAGFANPAAWPCLGHVEVADIGLPAAARPAGASPQRFIGAPEVGGLLPRRPAAGHKGDFGHVLAIAGAAGFTGAPALVALGALRAGAGLVTVAAPADCLPAVACHAPGAMMHVVATEGGGMTPAALAAGVRDPASFDVVIAGPGLAAGQGTQAIVSGLAAGRAPRLVLDADALNVFAGRPEALRRPAGELAITPHPGEAARLLGVAPAVVQADRIWAVRELARRTGAVAVLKGAGTVVAAPGGEPWLNLTGNAGMATGGSGDVLAGAVAALWAQGLTALDAARLAVWLHGTAGDVAQWGNGGMAVAPEKLARAMDAAWRWLQAFA